MSVRSKDERFSWLWLGLAAVAIVALVIGWLQVGRNFWKLSSSATESSVLARA
jgi:hypothetical protein